jgi:tRNA U34 5-carboxymethylaminomethyl modifying GTPase MnmE/TrmE
LLEHLAASYRHDLSESVALVSQRQFHLLRRMEVILEGIEYTSTGDTELLSADLRALLAPLSELTGEVVNDDILTTLFSSFCIGK